MRISRINKAVSIDTRHDNNGPVNRLHQMISKCGMSRAFAVEWSDPIIEICGNIIHQKDNMAGPIRA